MKTRIVLKNGREFEYPNADLQRIQERRSLAVYDLSTFRIIAEFKLEEISLCDPATDYLAMDQSMSA